MDSVGVELRLRSAGRAPAPELLHAGWSLEHVEDDLCLEELQGAAAAPPAPYRLAPWSAAVGAGVFHAYVAAFRERPGFPGWPEARWLAWATGHPTFRPSLSSIVRDTERCVAYAVGALEADGAWIVQMGVVPGHRRRGLGRVLLERSQVAARALGVGALRLSVNENNPGAAALYAAAGFRFTQRRAVYVPLSSPLAS